MATIAVRGASRSRGDAARVGQGRTYGDARGVARRGAAERVGRKATTILRNDSDAMQCAWMVFVCRLYR
jgi:hypothetical protein